jgi:hypothetical protein
VLFMSDAQGSPDLVAARQAVAQHLERALQACLLAPDVAHLAALLKPALRTVSACLSTVQRCMCVQSMARTPFSVAFT